MTEQSTPPDAVIRLLPERHPDAARTCARCLQPVGRAEHDAFDYYCMACDEAATTFPWQTTHGGATR